MKKFIFLILLSLLVSGCAIKKTSLTNNNEVLPMVNSISSYPIDSEFATSTNDKLVYFIRDVGDHRPSEDFADGIDNINQIIARDLSSNKEEVILQSGALADLKIANLPDHYPIKEIHTIRNLLLSNNNDVVYFEVPAWVTSDAVFSVDLKTKNIRYITDGTLVRINTAGEFMGYLVVNQRYMQDGSTGVLYCDYIIDAVSGKRLKDLKSCL